MFAQFWVRTIMRDTNDGGYEANRSRRSLQMAPAAPQPSFLATRRGNLHFSVQGLQWVLSGYLLTYGGFMLLGGRAGDLLGRRRVLVAGTALFALSSLAGGFANDAGVLVGARIAQGIGAAMMMPAALSILTTSF